MVNKVLNSNLGSPAPLPTGCDPPRLLSSSSSTSGCPRWGAAAREAARLLVELRACGRHDPTSLSDDAQVLGFKGLVGSNAVPVPQLSVSLQ